MYHYANILFTGEKCNLQCYECIGNHPSLQDLPTNLTVFPPKNIEKLLEITNKYKIKDLAFTGTNVDPQLYLYEAKLVEYIKARLTNNTKLSLHTNGLLALRKMDIFNSYDKASISLPSFNPETYEKITTSSDIPDIKRITNESNIPIKLSMLLTPFNINDIPDYLKQSSGLGIKRIVIRKLKGKEKQYPIENAKPFKYLKPNRFIFTWPVYNIDGIEVTICGFDKSSAKGLFLFSDGRLEDKLI